MCIKLKIPHNFNKIMQSVVYIIKNKTFWTNNISYLKPKFVAQLIQIFFRIVLSWCDLKLVFQMHGYSLIWLFDWIISRSCLLPLREKFPNTEFFLVRIFLNPVRIRGNTNQKKLRIWPLFTRCFHLQKKSSSWFIRFVSSISSSPCSLFSFL